MTLEEAKQERERVTAAMVAKKCAVAGCSAESYGLGKMKIGETADADFKLGETTAPGTVMANASFCKEHLPK